MFNRLYLVPSRVVNSATVLLLAAVGARLDGRLLEGIALAGEHMMLRVSNVCRARRFIQSCCTTFGVLCRACCCTYVVHSYLSACVKSNEPRAQVNETVMVREYV